MTEVQRRVHRHATGWARSTARVCVVAMLVALNLGGGAASAYWSAGSVVSGSGGLAVSAATVNQGKQPTATAAKKSVTVNWSASTLSNGDTVSGYVVKRFAAGTLVPATVLSGCTGTIAAVTLTCTEIGVPEGSWVYSVTPKFATSWTGAESPRSAPVASDATPPTNDITLSGVSGGAFTAGSTLFYRGIDSGSLTLTNTLTDAGAGPASSTTGSLTGGLPGPTHTASTVSTPIGGPYVSGPFTWSAGSTATREVTVTGGDAAGNTAAATFSLVDDSKAPIGGALGYYDGTTARTSVSVSFAAVTDGGSGVATRVLQRAEASLTSGGCGNLSIFKAVAGGTNPISPLTDAVVAGHCYKYQYVVWDNVGNKLTVSNASVVKVSTYSDAVNATTGLLSYWRLGESAALVDTFDGDSAGQVLQDWSGAGMRWMPMSSWTSTEGVITAQGRLRKQGDSVGALYYSAVPPASADYTVAADVTILSTVPDDEIGIVGRLDPTKSGTFYAASYARSTSGAVKGCWTLYRVDHNSIATLGENCGPTLAVPSTHRLELVMNGSLITVRVDDADVVSVTEKKQGVISGPGRGGVYLGLHGAATALSDTTGLQLDNFTLTPQTTPTLIDSTGSNNGVYVNGPILGVPGALSGDANTAATFDGVNDYGRVAREISDDFSIEFWFSSLQTSGTGQSQGTGSQWWQGAGLVDAEVDGAKSDFGVSMFSDGRVVAGVGFNPSDVSILSKAGYNDGRWHHVVFTRTSSSGAMSLYVDGVHQGTKNGDTGVLDAAKYLTFGRIQTGTYSFAGSLDEIAVYTTVLTPETVQAHYVPVP